MGTTEGIGIDVAALAGPLVDLGMGLAGTARDDVVLHLVGTTDYSPAAGRNVETGSVDVPLKALKYSELDAEVPDAAMLMINPSDIPAGVRAPRNDDKVTINGERWTINQREPVPGDAVYIFRIRK
jgi:hypothetical protein